MRPRPSSREIPSRRRRRRRAEEDEGSGCSTGAVSSERLAGPDPEEQAVLLAHPGTQQSALPDTAALEEDPIRPSVNASESPPPATPPGLDRHRARTWGDPPDLGLAALAERRERE